MITNKELNAVRLSPTKKDFYQIWNELLDTAGKISDRWDPTSTNESDPGIVLLKVLTAVADKLNYNIDVNTLEAFMPSAAQEESMRKLTEMLGYNMKYYQSATTEVKISYNKNVEAPIQGILVIDKFTNIKDIDDHINYITLEPLNLTNETPFGNVACMEGELVECETADNNIVSMFHLDDNKRYFLPETQIAENSIFITNIENNIEGAEWRRVTNLNAQSLGAKVFKFGFDSQMGLPYVQFPEDISTIIEDGLRIKYVRTSGGDGNVSLNTLTKLTAPQSWSLISPENKQAYHDITNFTVTNIRAATNGSNREGIEAAYNNFKKTIGTFDTLVTCRDYMNKIYQLVSSVDNTTPLVSNVIVSDIKSDINRAITVGTFTSRGIEYKVKARPGKTLTNFDLMLYPFKSTYGLNSKQEFNKSFKYDNSNYSEILTDLEDTKTLAHNLVSPTGEEIACIKNYYKLRAKINTIRKVGVIEQASILNNIYKKLFETFNMRQMDFGEEIPYDMLLKVIESADARIKNISLDEPILSTKFLRVDNKEVDITDDEGKEIYNTLVRNNVLAGRVPLFNYNTDFRTDFSEKAYSVGDYEAIYPTSLTEDDQTIHKLVTEFEVPMPALMNDNTLKLTEHEVIQFRAPSLKTTRTYPAYVNYYFKRDKSTTPYVQTIPATFQTLWDFLRGGPGAVGTVATSAFDYYINQTSFPRTLIQECEISEELRSNQGNFQRKFDEVSISNGAIFKAEGGSNPTYYYIPTSAAAWDEVQNNANIKFYCLKFDKEGESETGIAAWNSWLVNLTTAWLDCNDSQYGAHTRVDNVAIKGFYKFSGGNLQGHAGYLVDYSGTQFRLVETPKTISDNPFLYYRVPRLWLGNASDGAHTTDKTAFWHTKDGLGQNSVPSELTPGCEYALGPGEHLFVNWTQTKEGSNDTKEEFWLTYGEGDIIKPNFRLADSEDWYNAHHSFTKLNVATKYDAFPEMPGMFTLDTNEQIEVRELIQVTLNSRNTNLYWEIPNLVSTSGGYLEFPFNEEPVNPTTGTPVIVTSTMKKNDDYIYTAYTLKEGEYLYYTDMNKSNIAYYGFGSTIRRGIHTPTIFKYTADDVISTSEISTNGINAAIPWRNYNLNGDNQELTITENQFINLTAGDELVTLYLTNNAHTDPSTIINNDYLDVDNDRGASWKTAGDGVLVNLPTLDLKDPRYTWQVRSKLNLAVGPNKTQTLKTKEVSYMGDPYRVRDKITLVNTLYDAGVGRDSELETLAAQSSSTPLSIKANKNIQSAATTTDVTDKKIDAEGNLEEIIANLQLKLFETEVVTNNKGQVINFGNYENGLFTTINFEEQLSQINAATNTPLNFDLNLLIPSTNFGLLMVYYQRLDTAAVNRAQLSWTKNNNVSYFNDTTTYSKSLTLRDGLNIFKIAQSDVLKLNSNGNNKAVITFGNLDLVPSANSINPKLCYEGLNGKLAEEQILLDLKEDLNETDANLKVEFYYNMPIAQHLDIDMNPKDDHDNLSNALSWFNYNNINNAFVISEIDTEHLTDDIVIAKSSRSNF